MRWRLADANVAQFFDVRSVWDLDNQQLKLAYWVNIYSSVYALPSSERPIEQVIEDDEKFDEWMEKPNKTADSEANQKSFYGHHGRKSIGG